MSTSTLTNPQAFPSLSSLRTGHLDLLSRFREDKESPMYALEIRDFIERVVKSGVTIDRNEERRNAQSILDYWGSRLYRLNGTAVENILASFDPDLAPDLEDGLCPYVGLDYFGEGKKQLFFGRQDLLVRLVPMLKDQRLVIVVGPSGSGKSSLVRAGLIPALKSGDFPEERWLYLPQLVPGQYPLEMLNEVLTHAEGRDVVLVIDQFEEVFSLCGDEQTRREFAHKLVELTTDMGREHRVIITLRTDYRTQMTRLPELDLESNYFQVTPLKYNELREAIEAPANLIGLKFEEGLVDSLVNDILGEPAALPLLQFTLLKLWESREHNRILRSAYNRLGGGRAALKTCADQFYESLIEEDRIAAEQILLRLVSPGEGSEITSNRMLRQDLYYQGYARDRLDRVLDKFVREHLLRLTSGKTPDQDQFEVAHEALIRNWPRLTDLLNEERERLRERRRMTATAEQWQAHNHDPSFLLRGSLLLEAAKYDHLNELEDAFVRAGQAAEAAEEAAKEEARQREARYARRVAQISNSGVILTICLLISGLLPFSDLVIFHGAIGTSTVKDLFYTIIGLGSVIALMMMIRIMILSFANTTLYMVLDRWVGKRIPVLATPQSFQPGQVDIPRAARLKAAISYIIPVFSIGTLTKRKTESKFALFHAVQSFILAAFGLVFFCSASLIFLGLPTIIFILFEPLYLFEIIFAIYAAIQAFRGKYPRLPFIGNLILNRLNRQKSA